MTKGPEPTLEELRPREWCITWRYRVTASPLSSWEPFERSWASEREAFDHANALRTLGNVTDEIRHIAVSVRVAPLAAGDWSDVDESGWVDE